MKQLLKTLCAVTCTVSSLSAFTLDEAVQEALTNNHDLQSQKYIYEQSQRNVQLQQSAYLPKVDFSYVYNNRDKSINEQLDKDSTLSAIASYNLFNGLSDFNTISSAKFLEKSSEYTLKALTQDIVLQTKAEYINYLNSKKNLSTFQDAFKLFDKQYVDAKIRFEQGLLAKNDLLQVHVNLLCAKQNVINAKKDLKLSLLNLSNIIGGRVLSKEKIEELNLIDFDRLQFDKTTLENRSELQALKMTMNSYKSLAKAQKGSFLPSVDAQFSASKYGDDSGLSSIEDYPSHQETATISAKWNLYNGGANYAQIKIYLAQKKELYSKLQKTLLDIDLQFERAILEFDVAKQNLETSELGLEQAQENYKIVNNRFNEGLSSTTDLIDANYLLTQAKQRYFQSYYNKFLAVAALNRILEKDY